MIRKIVYNFSKKSASDLVPNILKHPKFTREGINKKKVRNYQHDLDQPHIVNKHLYFNKETQKKEQRLRYKENKALQSPYQQIKDLQESRDPQLLKQELLDQDLLRSGSRRILNNIIQIEKLTENDQDIALFEQSLKQVKFIDYNFRDFGIYTNLCSRYLENDANHWLQITQNFIRFIERKQYNDNTAIFSENNTKNKRLVSNFVFIFNEVIKKVEKFEFKQEQELLQKIAMNYFADSFQKVPEMNQRALLLASLGKVLPSNPQSDDFEFYQDFINISVFNHIKINELQLGSLIALTHMLYRRNLQVTDKTLQEIQAQFLKSKDTVDQKQFSVFILAIGNLIKGAPLATKEFQKFAQSYPLSQYSNNNASDFAFTLEGLRKLNLTNKQIFDKFEKEIQENITNLEVRQSLQLLRSCKINQNFRFSDDTVKQLIENVDKQFQDIKQNEKEMVTKTLNKFQSFVDFNKYENLSLAL